MQGLCCLLLVCQASCVYQANLCCGQGKLFCVALCVWRRHPVWHSRMRHGFEFVCAFMPNQHHTALLACQHRLARGAALWLRDWRLYLCLCYAVSV